MQKLSIGPLSHVHLQTDRFLLRAPGCPGFGAQDKQIHILTDRRKTQELHVALSLLSSQWQADMHKEQSQAPDGAGTLGSICLRVNTHADTYLHTPPHIHI